jgi:hypothetical protein
MTGAMSRRAVLRTGLHCAPLVFGAGAATECDAAPASAYVDPTIMAKLPFGTRSHYLQPWRGYLDTVGATQFLAGIGVVLDGGTSTSEAVLDTLAANSVAGIRLEISWSELDFDDESRLTRADAYRRLLASCRARRLRPLILLNANHGLPVPTLQFSRTITTDVEAGARIIALDSVDQIILGRTGLSNLSGFWAAEALVTAVEGNRVVLSKPLPKRLRAGARVQLATLKYAPFGAPGAPSTIDTLAGWVRYVDVVSRFVGEALNSADAADKGFDLEVWNELSFGSKFLSIENYYDRPTLRAADWLYAAIVGETAAWVAGHPQAFAGVGLSNGFASTIPWPAASTQPPPVTALSKHPYPRQLLFPQDDPEDGRCIDARGNPTRYVPRYEAFFPEYFASAIQSETIVRDMGPNDNSIQGAMHGRFARHLNGVEIPVSVWITEIGVNATEIGVTGDAETRLLKAKATARALLFYLNKGAGRVYLYSATGGDRGYGVVTDSAAHGALASANAKDEETCSPALQVIHRIAEVLRGDDVTASFQARALRFSVHAAPDSAPQFLGDGSVGNPPLRNVDTLALLPYQTGERRFVVAHYFVTRDIRRPTRPEPVTVEIGGLSGGKLTASTYDPMADSWLALRIAYIASNLALVTLDVSDSPRLLVIRD